MLQLKWDLDRNLIHLEPLWSTLPTQFALFVPIPMLHKLLFLSEFSHSLFFNILHPPLNVPALGKLSSRAVETSINHCVAVSLNEDVDTNKELVAHGYSNILAGVFGTVYVALVAVYMID